MEIKILKSVLLEKLQIVLKAVSAKSTVPILECVLLNAVKEIDQGTEYLRLRSYDNEMGIETKNISCDIIEPGAIALDAKMFLEIIRHLPEGTVSISSDSKNVTIIKCQKSEFKILGQFGDEFPQLPVVNKNKSYRIDETILKDMVKRTIFSVSLDEQRPAMMGELIEINNNELRVVAVDGFRVSYCYQDLPFKMEYDEDMSVIIPAKTLSEICKISADTNGELTLFLDDSFALFEFDSFLLVSRVINGEFIKYEPYFITESQTVLTVRRQILIGAIERATLISYKDSTKKNPVKLQIKDNVVTISSNAENGTVFDELDAEVDGSDIEIAFNPRFLLDALKALDEDTILVNFTTNLSPCIIKGAESDYYKYLVLPLRVFN